MRWRWTQKVTVSVSASDVLFKLSSQAIDSPEEQKRLQIYAFSEERFALTKPVLSSQELPLKTS
jgi:hypothetical protein